MDGAMRAYLPKSLPKSLRNSGVQRRAEKNRVPKRRAAASDATPRHDRAAKQRQSSKTKGPCIAARPF